MKGELKIENPNITIEFDSDIKETKIISANCIELKMSSKLRIKGFVKWLIDLLKLH